MYPDDLKSAIGKFLEGYMQLFNGAYIQYIQNLGESLKNQIIGEKIDRL